MSKERTAILAHIQTSDDHSFRRTAMFARLRANKLLQGPCTELGRNVSNGFAAYSVVAIILKSSAADCTLFEFQNLAMIFLSDSSFQCVAFFFVYHVKFPGPSRCSRLYLAFPSFPDMCESLKIDMATREFAVYRERCNRERHILAAQVLGGQVFRSSTRSILLRYSAPTTPGTLAGPTLYQETTSWTDDTWKSEFDFRAEPSSAFCNALVRKHCREKWALSTSSVFV